MVEPVQKPLTVDEYLAITAGLDDDMKWELIDGVMTPKPARVQELAREESMAPERRRHARVKTLTGIALATPPAPCTSTRRALPSTSPPSSTDRSSMRPLPFAAAAS